MLSVAHLAKNPPQCRKCRFDFWVSKMPCRRAQQPTALFLHGESHGQRSLVGYSPWGCKELDMTEKPALSKKTLNKQITGIFPVIIKV